MKFLGMLILSTVTCSNALAQNITFDDIETRHWTTVNDTVMGGISDSDFFTSGGIATFHGNLSLENNGGFASVRRLIPPELYTGGKIQLRVKGDGRTYQFRLKTTDLYQGAAYVSEFKTRKDEWQTIVLSEQDFTARFRGRYISDAPDLKFGRAIQMGFLIGDKRVGYFQLNIQRIEALQVI